MPERSRVFTAGRNLLRFLAFLVVLVAVYLIAAPILEIGGVTAPRSQSPTLLRLKQWPSDQDSLRFHHTSQGTKILPLSWFLALEQPVFTPFPVGRLASRDYLSRFGFIYETSKPASTNKATDVAEWLSAGTEVAGSDKYTRFEADVARFDLPVGFAIERDFVAPYADPPVATKTPVVGLTCAGCHTGRVEIKLDDGTTKAVLIDGGSAMINISLFQKAVGRALFFTQFFPDRFRRFSRNVFGSDLPANDPQRAELEKSVGKYISLGLGGQQYAKEHKLNGTDSGFARTDALGLIGNRVFGVLNQENQIVTDAPVNFPALWDTPWFDWVQYNASIRSPIARNIGEALGVGAIVNLNDAKYPLYESTVNLEGLSWMEDALGGMEPFGGLRPPKWDEMVKAAFGKDAEEKSDYFIKKEQAHAGEKLYKIHCLRCHLPPRETLKEDLRKPDSPYFTKPDPGSDKRFLRLNVVDLNVIGTDPNQALNFYRRIAVSPEPRFPYEQGDVGQKADKADAAKKAITNESFAYWSRWVKEGSPNEGLAATISAEEGLFRVTSMIRRKQYSSESLQLLADADSSFKKPKFKNDDERGKERMKWDRFRSIPPLLDKGDERAIIEGQGKDWVIKANLGYRARPHDGVWATPPYLHNGSVPNLYQMLIPAAARSKVFYLGSTRFDPKHVGYETSEFTGAFEMDTSLAGNSNSGHEFRNLTLEELEQKEWDGSSTREQRWASVLGVSLETLGLMTTQERWRRTRDVSKSVLETQRVKPVRGVLGPEFTDEERWQLVEYLKTL